MSVPEASGQNLNPAPTMPGRRPDFPTNLDGTLGPDTAHDPLLQSGSFIDATTTTPTPTSNGKTRKEAKKPKKTPEKSASAEPSGSGPENPDIGGGRGKRRGMMEPLESWLPQGWTVEEKVRTNGATAGSTDRYYFDPVSGRRFRSKIEVLYFLETGTLKGKKTPENSSAGKRPAEGSGSQKQKKSSTKPKSPALNFDFVNVPEKVVWVLQDSAVGSWTPFIANVKVPESTVKEWEAAFTVVSSRK